MFVISRVVEDNAFRMCVLSGSRLSTPTFDPVNGTEGCLTFFFSMIGEGAKRLLVRQDEKIISSLDKYLNTGREWVYYEKDVSLNNNTMVGIEEEMSSLQ